jgi:hypothetical protein
MLANLKADARNSAVGYVYIKNGSEMSGGGEGFEVRKTASLARTIATECMKIVDKMGRTQRELPGVEHLYRTVPTSL